MGQLSGWLGLLRLCPCSDSSPQALLNTHACLSFVFLHHLNLSCPMLPSLHLTVLTQVSQLLHVPSHSGSTLQSLPTSNLNLLLSLLLEFSEPAENSPFPSSSPPSLQSMHPLMYPPIFPFSLPSLLLSLPSTNSLPSPSITGHPLCTRHSTRLW